MIPDGAFVTIHRPLFSFVGAMLAWRTPKQENEAYSFISDHGLCKFELDHK